jgi:hypothetical protein
VSKEKYVHYSLYREIGSRKKYPVFVGSASSIEKTKKAFAKHALRFGRMMI